MWQYREKERTDESRRLGATGKIKQFLAKPFPQEESLFDTFKIVSGISIFVVLFLYFFKPFGMHLLQSGLFTICLGFGAVTFFTSLLYEFIVVKLLKLKGDGANFTFARWIVYFLCVMLLISVANFLFIRLVLFGSIDWSLLPVMMRGTVLIGLFPAIVIGALALVKQERKYRNIAAQINQNSPSIENKKFLDGRSVFGIPANDIRYIEAMQNYIKIGHVDASGDFIEHAERATLKSVHKDEAGAGLFRCHRSFLVNREYVVSASGNSQGLSLSLEGCNKTVPVSRSYVASFRQH